ncbi:VOC family protein [Plantibacter sp. Mn2098]|uniref:VOC family protein n=1 Tax=Plantibacter sp. Mn2098 TaxID=3395266 RepID=UPI003BDE604B
MMPPPIRATSTVSVTHRVYPSRIRELFAAGRIAHPTSTISGKEIRSGVLNLQNVTYLVRDIDHALRFFTDALGFVVRQDETFESGWRRVVVGPDGGGTGFVLALAVDDDAPVGRQAAGDVAFFLETDDFAGQHRRMVEAGVHFREDPRHEAYGTVAVFEDLYGMPWDLIEPPKR